MLKDIAELIKACAALLWPILGFVTVLLFKSQLRLFIDRLRKGKLFGQELELDESLSRLNRDTTQAVSEIPLIEAPATPTQARDSQREAVHDEEILKIAAQSPRAALITLAARIEKEARNLLATTGHLKGRTNLSFPQALTELEAATGLPRHLSSTVQLFWAVRNRIVHGHAASDDDVLRAIDSGMTILKGLQAIPHETYVVYHPGVPIYGDSEAKQAIPNSKGVILETTSQDGKSKWYSIFPTTRTHFKKGMRVAWEWSFGRVWNQAWYRDPDTSDIKNAWGSAAEFIGRDLDEV